MRRVLSSAIVVLMLAFGLHAQTAPDAAELTRLLKEFLDGASRNDAAVHDRFWAEDLIYTGSSGRRIGKADIMRDVRSSPAPKPADPTTVYSAEDIRIQQYGSTAVVAFRLVGATTKAGKTEIANYLNTGTFLKRNDKWQVVSWQATKMPRQEESAGRGDAGPAAPSAGRRTQPPPSVRLYVLDCGTLHIADTGRFGLKPQEVAASDLAVPCFLITHPKGTLIWDTGAVPDSAWKPTGTAVTHHVVLPDSQQRDVTVIRPLMAQLAEVGYSPANITYLALSHYHYDHTANANEFSAATWLVRQEERDAMFAEKPPGVTQPSTYAALRNSKTLIINSTDHDVFGDRTVVIKAAPGHTPGHQVLYLKLARSGGVLLSGDLYHYPEERTLNRVPTFEFNQEQTRAARVAVDAFLKKTVAQLWIQHDLTANARLKKAPGYYE